MAEEVDCQEGCTHMPMAYAYPPKVYIQPPYSLWSSAIHWNPEDSHWEMGFTWMSDGCATGGCYPQCVECPEEGVDPEIFKEINASVDEVVCRPYTIYVRDCCGTKDYRTQAKLGSMEERMRRKLLQARGPALECFFAGGSCNEELTKVDICDPDGEPAAVPECALINGTCPEEITTALSPCDALCALVDSLCGCPTGIGMIHAPSYLVGKWHACGMLESFEVDFARDYGIEGDTGGTRRLLRECVGGNIVVSGCGYNGIGPDGTGQAESECLVWAYATSMVCLSYGDISVYQSIDPATNLECVIAEQTVAATFDPCCHVAIPVNLCGSELCSSCSEPIEPAPAEEP